VAWGLVVALATVWNVIAFAGGFGQPHATISTAVTRLTRPSALRALSFVAWLTLGLGLAGGSSRG